ALGAPVERDHGGVGVRAFQHGGFDADVPGDVSSAMFLIAAAGITAGELRVDGVGLNPTRTAALEVARRMGRTVPPQEQGPSGGATDARGDHRLAMAFVVAALGARGPSVITGVETAAVSFPGFLSVMSGLGADVEVEP